MKAKDYVYDKSSDKIDKIDIEQKEVIEQGSSFSSQLSVNTHKERELVRKLDRRVLPIIYTVYLFGCQYSLFTLCFQFMLWTYMQLHQFWPVQTWETRAFKVFQKTHFMGTPAVFCLIWSPPHSIFHL